MSNPHAVAFFFQAHLWTDIRWWGSGKTRWAALTTFSNNLLFLYLLPLMFQLAVSARSTYVTKPSIKLLTALRCLLQRRSPYPCPPHLCTQTHTLKISHQPFWAPLHSIKLVRLGLRKGESCMERQPVKAEGWLKLKYILCLFTAVWCHGIKRELKISMFPSRLAQKVQLRWQQCCQHTTALQSLCQKPPYTSVVAELLFQKFHYVYGIFFIFFTLHPCRPSWQERHFPPFEASLCLGIILSTSASTLRSAWCKFHHQRV